MYIKKHIDKLILEYLITKSAKSKNILIKLHYIDFATRFQFYSNYYSYCNYNIEKILIDIANNYNIPLNNPQKNSLLHVYTNLNGTGGHSLLSKNWINRSNDFTNHTILILQKSKNKPTWLKELLSDKVNLIDLSDETNLINKSLKLRQLASEYTAIILYTHMVDIVPVIAFGLKTFYRPIIYFNHADHLFWIGGSISDLVIENRHYGENITHKYRNLNNTQILPIPINIENKKIEKFKAREILGIDKNIKVFLTIASSYKYKQKNKYPMIDLLRKLSKEINNYIIIFVGPDSNEKIWKTAAKDNIITVGIIPYSDIYLYYSAADIYLDSFPLPSITSTLEAVAYHLPVVALQTPYGHADIFKNISLKSKIDYINKIKDLFYNSTNVEALYDNLKIEHSEENWKDKFNNIENTIQKINHNVLIRESIFLSDKKQIQTIKKSINNGSKLILIPILLKEIPIIDKLLTLVIILYKSNYKLLTMLIKRIFKK